MDAEWPTSRAGTPLPLAVRIDLGALPEVVWLPASGLVQLFVDPLTDGVDPAVVWCESPDAVVERTDGPSGNVCGVGVSPIEFLEFLSTPSDSSFAVATGDLNDSDAYAIGTAEHYLAGQIDGWHGYAQDDLLIATGLRAAGIEREELGCGPFPNGATLDEVAAWRLRVFDAAMQAADLVTWKLLFDLTENIGGGNFSFFGRSDEMVKGDFSGVLGELSY